MTTQQRDYRPHRLGRFVHILIDTLADTGELNHHLANDWNVVDSAITHDRKFSHQVAKHLEEFSPLLYSSLLVAAQVYNLVLQGKTITVDIAEGVLPKDETLGQLPTDKSRWLVPTKRQSTAVNHSTKTD